MSAKLAVTNILIKFTGSTNSVRVPYGTNARMVTFGNYKANKENHG